MSARTSAGVYTTDELAGDQRGLELPADPPPLLLLPPLLPDEKWEGGEYDGAEYDG